ncbi:MAG: aminotransferase class V-fold PLP-dependent enzyme [Candidatus Cloacimonetes bacterium]|nr:aminotransferase class V-fold PLP-dependent enzyme [Candidatus Cloacimonadota bacterium]
MIYLDNAATSFPKAPGVVDAVCRFLNEIGANAGRSSYSTARDSARIIYQTRSLMAKLLHTDSSERICFTMNTTQALNIAIKGLVKPGYKVLTSPYEHNSVMRPLRQLESKGLISLNSFLINQYETDWQYLETQLDQNTDLLVLNAASNVNGFILPYQKIAQIAHNYNVPVILDAAQAIGSLPINAADYDIICFPGHKGLLAPMGTGGLYVSQALELEPLITGGTGSRSSSEYQPFEMPDRLESGTPNLPGIAGLRASLKFILNAGIDNIAAQKRKLTMQLMQQLTEIEGITLHSPIQPELQAGVVSFTSARYSVSELAWEFDKADIACRMGLHCAPCAHKQLGTFSRGGTLRLSPGYFNTSVEIDQVIELLRELHK